MNPDANEARPPLFRLPVRKIKNAALRRAAIIASYPFMVLIALCTSTVSTVVGAVFVLAVFIYRAGWLYVRQQANLAESAGQAWRGEPLR